MNNIIVGYRLKLPDDPSEFDKFYKIIKGDTLNDILLRRYGYIDEDIIREVSFWNVITNPDNIEVGKILYLPNKNVKSNNMGLKLIK